MKTSASIIVALFVILLSVPAHTVAAPPLRLAGFETSKHFDEQQREFEFEPDVLIRINAPAADKLDANLPTRLIIFALPNGNTTAQTVGKQMAEGVDWHYNIQHIGAQTRTLREKLTDCNLVVAYVEARSRSWPRWRSTHEDSGDLIIRLIDTLRQSIAPLEPTVELIAHSGGGSMLFGYIEAVESIPNWLTRIVWLDANYNYRDEKHADKLIQWLRAKDDHALGAISYDDRYVEINGKRIVSDTGGTYRRTTQMAERFTRDFPLTQTDEGEYLHWSGLDDRIELIALHNPDKKIWHTVLVERNGFIHAATFGTKYAKKVGTFWSEAAYRDWIQDGD